MSFEPSIVYTNRDCAQGRDAEAKRRGTSLSATPRCRMTRKCCHTSVHAIAHSAPSGDSLADRRPVSFSRGGACLDRQSVGQVVCCRAGQDHHGALQGASLAASRIARAQVGVGYADLMSGSPTPGTAQALPRFADFLAKEIGKRRLNPLSTYPPTSSHRKVGGRGLAND